MSQSYKDLFEFIAFEGGGIKGIAYIGAILYLEKIGLLKKLRGFIGSSAGAFTALLLYCGLNGEQLKEEMINFPFKELLDDDF